MGGDMGGGWWWMMGIGWLVFIGLIVVVVLAFARQSVDRSRPRPGGVGEDVLADRFARGEIDHEEYVRRRDLLRG